MSRANPSNLEFVTSSTRRAREARVFSSVSTGLCMACILLAGLLSCVKAPHFDVVPKIDFVSLSKDTMRQGLNQQDSIIVTFHFEDGDGDIGRMTDSNENNVFVYDTRTGQLDNSFGIPFVPPQGSSNGIEGEVHIKLYSTCCIYPVGDPCVPSTEYPTDHVSYEIHITDRAGNSSNVITTPDILLLCD